MIIVEPKEVITCAMLAYGKKTGKGLLSLKKIEKYGKEVVKYLKQDGEDVKYFFSSNLVRLFFANYSNMFTFIQRRNLVYLNDDITFEKLEDSFTYHMNPKLLRTFFSSDMIEFLM